LLVFDPGLGHEARMTEQGHKDSNSRATSDARLAAFRIVEDVLQRGRTLDEAEADRIDPDMAARDRAFCRRIVYAVLRRKGEIDRLAKRYLRHLPTGRGRALETVVRVGLAQILFTDVPPYAAADATVELARAARLGGFAKLVNAIMRRAVDDAGALFERLASIKVNTPNWMWERWVSTYGEDTARAIAKAHMAEPPLDLMCRNDTEAAEWAAKVGGAEMGGGVVRLRPSGPVTELPGFEEGAWWVQDIAATLPVRLLGDVRGKRVADLCAAPGGKTLQLAARGALVTAVDRSASRLRRLHDNLARTRLAAEVVTADASQWSPGAAGSPDNPFDAVLVDAPCSATGTIRRHPDIPWIRSETDIRKLADLQHRLLVHAADLVRPGGLVVFCTCSLEPEEGAAQADRAIAEGAPLERIAIDPALLADMPDVAGAIREQGDLRTHPGMLADRGGMDGFYAALLRRT